MNSLRNLITNNMTPKEKAKELIRQFYSVGAIECKQCALIAVDEIINVAKPECHIETAYNLEETLEYWEEVKQKLEKL